jgi:hypothetical protein
VKGNIMRRTALITGAAAAALTAGTLLASPASAATTAAPVTLSIDFSMPSYNLAFAGEQGTTLNAAAFGGNPAPTGGMLVMADPIPQPPGGPTPVCVFTLVNGRGGCILRPGQLLPGSYHLIIAYGGDANHPPVTVTWVTPLVITS